MNKRRILGLAAAGVTLGTLAGGSVFTARSVAAPVAATQAKMDAPVKAFTLQDVMADSEKSLSTGAFKGKKGTVLFFVSSTCPVTWRYEKRVGQLMQRFGKDVAFIGIKSHARESAEDIRRFAEARNFDMPVLLDEKNAVSRYYGMRVTPSFVFIDKKGVMRYKGAFDDSPDEKAVSQRYLQNAMLAAKSGKPVAVKQTMVPG